MAYGTSRGKSSGRTQNMAKLGGAQSKLRLISDMKDENMQPGYKKATKQGPHKKV